LNCIDIDECEKNIHNCSHFCLNQHGTHYCKCPEGLLSLSLNHIRSK
jgi:hypothetical protein